MGRLRLPIDSELWLHRQRTRPSANRLHRYIRSIYIYMSYTMIKINLFSIFFSLQATDAAEDAPADAAADINIR